MVGLTFVSQSNDLMIFRNDLEGSSGTKENKQIGQNIRYHLQVTLVSHRAWTLSRSC